MSLTFISLFAGIGGIDLGLERAGMQCVAQVEIDDYANRVLAKHWPGVRRFRDVRGVGAHNLPRADVIAGGFPCQDISSAGRGAGLNGERSGLWFEFRRIIRELRPSYVFVENVSALLHRGIDTVLGDLAALGFDAEWHCIPAAALGAPHIRDRVYIVAYSERNRRQQSAEVFRARQSIAAASRKDVSDAPITGNGRLAARQQGTETQAANADRCGQVLADADGSRRSWRQHEPKPQPRRSSAANAGASSAGDGSYADRQQRQRRAGIFAPALAAGIAAAEGEHPWRIEPDVGRVAHGVPARVDRLRGLGNAVVPDCAELVGRQIVAHAQRVVL